MKDIDFCITCDLWTGIPIQYPRD